MQVLHNVEVDECRFHLGTPGRTWIDVAGRPSPDMLRDLGMAFNLHPLALEDVFHANQRAKLDLYEGQGFIVLNDPAYERARSSCARSASSSATTTSSRSTSTRRTSSSRCATA